MNSYFYLAAITGIVDSLMSFGIAYHLYRTYRNSPTPPHAHFLYFFVFLGAFFFFYAAPQFIFSSGSVVSFFSILAYVCLYVGLAFLLGLPFVVQGRIDASRGVLLVMLLFNACFTALRLYYFEAFVLEVTPAYVYWRPVYPEWLRIITGLVAATATGSAAFLFVRFGWVHRDNRQVFYRSLWLCCGVSMLVLASFLGFVVAPSGSAPLVILATMFVLLGLLVTLRGVIYRTDES